MESNFKKIACAGPDDQDKRIDRIIRTIFPSLPLGIIYREIRKGRIRINLKKTEASRHISTGDSIEIHDSLLQTLKKDIDTIKIQSKERTVINSNHEPLEIIFENSMILALNKPAGIAVHSGSRNKKRNSADQVGVTLDEIVKARYQDITGRSLSFSPSPLHRLDKNTSGLILFGKSIEGARIITELLRKKKIRKKYIALLDGYLETPSEWVDFLAHDTDKGIAVNRSHESGGREAFTRATPLLHSKNHTLAAVEIETGRYHQIRKQCAMHGHPLSCDIKYGSYSKDKGSYVLHCWSVKLELTDKDRNPGFTLLTAGLPEDTVKRISGIFGPDEIDKLFNDISLLI